jgi:hypothetical protein
MIDISYIEDEVEQEDPAEVEPSGPPPSRPRLQRWLAVGAVAALIAVLFAVASARTQPRSLRSADTVGVGEVYTVRVFAGERWMRVNLITLLAGTADGDGAALFVLEGRGWLPRQAGTLTVEECQTGEVTELGSWVVGGTGSFRFAHTDPGEGTYALTIEGLESEPVRILIGPTDQRVLVSPERGCPHVA